MHLWETCNLLEGFVYLLKVVIDAALMWSPALIEGNKITDQSNNFVHFKLYFVWVDNANDNIFSTSFIFERAWIFLVHRCLRSAHFMSLVCFYTPMLSGGYRKKPVTCNELKNLEEILFILRWVMGVLTLNRWIFFTLSGIGTLRGK